MGLIGDQKVKLAVLLYFNTNVIESLDWSITSKEILRARSECDYLQLLQSDYGPGHRNKVHYHPCHSLTVSHRILRDVGRNIPQVQVIGAVQHSAVSVSSAVNKVIAPLFCSRCIHDRSIKVFGD